MVVLVLVGTASSGVVLSSRDCGRALFWTFLSCSCNSINRLVLALELDKNYHHRQIHYSINCSFKTRLASMTDGYDDSP